MSGVHHFGWDCFAYVTVFLFNHRGSHIPSSWWCLLGMFLLLAFTHLGHECQDILGPCDGMCVCTDKMSVYTLIQKSFGGMKSEPMFTPRKNPLNRKNSPPRRIEPTNLHQAGQRAKHTINKLFWPPFLLQFLHSFLYQRRVVKNIYIYTGKNLQIWKCTDKVHHTDFSNQIISLSLKHIMPHEIFNCFNIHPYAKHGWYVYKIKN